MGEQPVATLIEDEFPGEWGGSVAGADLCEAFVLRATNFVDGGLDYSSGARRFVPRTKVARKRLRKGDLLLEAAGGGPGVPVGRVACFDPPDDRVYLVSNFFRTLRPASGADSRFAFHLLDDLYRQPKIWEVQQQTTGIINLKVQDYLQFPVRVPPLEEQRRIAEILDTVDETIQATERVIAKQSALLTGLSGYLFAQDTEHRRLSELSRRITYGFTNPMPTALTGPWMLTAADVGYRQVLLDQARRTSEAAFQGLLSDKSRPSAGDILVTKDGTLGRVAVLGSERACVNQSVAVISPFDPAESDFIAEYLLSPLGQQTLLAGAGGSTIKHLYISTMADLEIPWPDPDVRSRSVGTIRAAVDRVDALRAEVDKLRQVRMGLAADLLSGRVRTVVA